MALAEGGGGGSESSLRVCSRQQLGFPKSPPRHGFSVIIYHPLQPSKLFRIERKYFKVRVGRDVREDVNKNSKVAALISSSVLQPICILKRMQSSWMLQHLCCNQWLGILMSCLNTLKPIFHQNAKYLASGTFASPNAKDSTFASPNARNTNMLVSLALGDASFLLWPCTFLFFLCIFLRVG